MKTICSLTQALLLIVASLSLFLSVATPAVAGELPEKLISKGGIIYPRTGDSNQARFQTPPNFADFLSPGSRIGVLPDDCVEASSGTSGTYYRCDYGLMLQADGEDHQDQTIYQVIEKP